MGARLGWFGRQLAKYLSHPSKGSRPWPFSNIEQLRDSLSPGDVLLVEGTSRVSTAIKYLTQSTWSHAALYVGAHLPKTSGNPKHCFIEVDLVKGVRSVGIDEFTGFHTRICRPVGLSEEDCRKVTSYAISRLGHQYDLRNLVDLVRYLLPTPPVPQQFRRRMLALGSGDPTRAICSTLIAKSFQSIRYPILPEISTRLVDSPECSGYVEEIFRIRHHSLFTPCDFDVSPYFQIVKPTLESGFDFKAFNWADGEKAI